MMGLRRLNQQDAEPALSRRSFGVISEAYSWEEIWEAGPYYARISELLERAEHYAIFAGWQVDSRVRLRPGGETFREQVIRLCARNPSLHVYFLMWDHAYFYVLERETMQGRIWEDVHPRVHFIFDNRHPFGGSHHEKVALFDGRIGFCGSIDICDERWDSPSHAFEDPRRSLDSRNEHHGPYHDLAVQVTGPVVGEIQRHVGERWRVLSSVPFPNPPWGAAEPRTIRGHRVYVSRTVASIDAGERGIPMLREIEFLFRDLVATARHRIILEGQYYWSRSFNDCLIRKMRESQGTGLEIFIFLAEIAKLKGFSKQMGFHEMELLRSLEQTATETGTKLVMGIPFVHSESRAKSVYVHSKLILIDHRYLCIGSANLSSRAMRVDTEFNLTLDARTPSEWRHIDRVADHVLRHWGVLGKSGATGLREFQPNVQARELRRHHPIASRIPWNRFFDPDLPWLYRAKRRYRRLEGKHKAIVAGLVAALSIIGAILSLAFALPGPFVIPAAALALLMNLTWILPIPFLAIALLSALILPTETAARLSVTSLWTVALIGYGVARMFPTPVSKYQRKIRSRWLPERLGLRSFPYLVQVLFDPRVSFRAKIAYQGLYCVPAPWFILGTLMILPSALYVVVRYLLPLAIGTFTGALADVS